MKYFIKLSSMLSLFLSILVGSSSYAIEKLPDNLVSFSSEESVKLFKNNININTLKLLSHFTTQKNLTFCGIASAVMILNSAVDKSPADEVHPPYHYFTQDNFFDAQVKKIVTPDQVSNQGVNLMNLSKIIEAHGLKATPIFSNEINFAQFKFLIKSALNNNKFVIVNFLRSEINQEGGLHHSPIAAYDENTDRFLILDVSRYKYPAYWVKAHELWNATNVFANGTYHGFIIIENLT